MKKCNHENKRIKVLEVAATCETTVIVCTECEEELEYPETDC
ncbi:hypothetical protein OIU80_19765 [Flavobacterium sp. LS1R47]|jgi:hypothetical protein|uniref:Uncharacterized protein n=1 Tax=Flavobacterium frigoritolerans TaxID=2987686 RepID=A0A9X3HNJ1_9FLAO|nr:hypothetical protein [Flavobacterium frigoritolerans]MCV9934524.1 hypothetical protein [Flavobacterium frigoritolerans]